MCPGYRTIFLIGTMTMGLLAGLGERLYAEDAAVSPVTRATGETGDTIVPLHVTPTAAFKNGHRLTFKNVGISFVVPTQWEKKDAVTNEIVLGVVGVAEPLIVIRPYRDPDIGDLQETSLRIARGFTESAMMKVQARQCAEIFGAEAWIYRLSYENLAGKKWEQIKAYPCIRFKTGVEIAFNLPMDKAFIGEFLDNVKLVDIPVKSPEEILLAKFTPPDFMTRYNSRLDHRVVWMCGKGKKNPDVLLVGELLWYPVALTAGEAFKITLNHVLDAPKDDKVNVVSAEMIKGISIAGCETQGTMLGLDTGLTVVIVVAVPANSNVAHVFKIYFNPPGLKYKDAIMASISATTSHLPGMIDQKDVDEFVKNIEKKMQADRKKADQKQRDMTKRMAAEKKRADAKKRAEKRTAPHTAPVPKPEKLGPQPANNDEF